MNSFVIFIFWLLQIKQVWRLYISLYIAIFFSWVVLQRLIHKCLQHLSMECLGHMVCVYFWETDKLFQSGWTIFIPTSSSWKFQLLHIFANTWYVLFNFRYSNICVYSGISLWFYFAYPWWLIILSIFLCPYSISWVDFLNFQSDLT